MLFKHQNFNFIKNKILKCILKQIENHVLNTHDFIKKCRDFLTQGYLFNKIYFLVLPSNQSLPRYN